MEAPWNVRALRTTGKQKLYVGVGVQGRRVLKRLWDLSDKGHASLMVNAKHFSIAAPLKQWLRDVTEEGIEPHPGPCSSSSHLSGTHMPLIVGGGATAFAALDTVCFLDDSLLAGKLADLTVSHLPGTFMYLNGGDCTAAFAALDMAHSLDGNFSAQEPACLLVKAKRFSQADPLKQWRRDVTEEGIEPNPGACSSSSSSHLAGTYMYLNVGGCANAFAALDMVHSLDDKPGVWSLAEVRASPSEQAALTRRASRMGYRTWWVSSVQGARQLGAPNWKGGLCVGVHEDIGCLLMAAWQHEEGGNDEPRESSFADLGYQFIAPTDQGQLVPSRWRGSVIGH